MLMPVPFRQTKVIVRCDRIFFLSLLSCRSNLSITGQAPNRCQVNAFPLLRPDGSSHELEIEGITYDAITVGAVINCNL
jgi:hypothetical protein